MDIAVVGAGVSLDARCRGRLHGCARRRSARSRRRRCWCAAAGAALVGSQLDAGRAGENGSRRRARPASRSATSAAPSNTARKIACVLARRAAAIAYERAGGAARMSRDATSPRTVNGEPVEFLGGAGQSLLDALRDELRPHRQQGRLRHGRLRRLLGHRRRPAGLLLPDARAGGRRQAHRDRSRAWPTAAACIRCSSQFLEHAALQCGFCTPGLLVASKALLDRNPDPTETEVRYWLAGNMCRCTGYDKVVRAVLDAAKQLRQETSTMSDGNQNSSARR